MIRFQEKSGEEIKERNMGILLPFKLLSLRRELQKKRSQENIRKLLNLYRNDIIESIEEMYIEGSISAEDRRVLLSTARRLMDHLYRKYKEVQEVIAQMHDQSIRLDIDDYVDALEQKEEELAKKDEQLASKDEQIRLLTERLAKLEAEQK